jgi:hypothetical protein
MCAEVNNKNTLKGSQVGRQAASSEELETSSCWELTADQAAASKAFD